MLRPSVRLSASARSKASWIVPANSISAPQARHWSARRGLAVPSMTMRARVPSRFAA